MTDYREMLWGVLESASISKHEHKLLCDLLDEHDRYREALEAVVNRLPDDSPEAEIAREALS